MQTKMYTTLDRTGWQSGPWDSEPDKVQWQDEATELPCLAVRHPQFGFWCGYVGVPPGHPYSGMGHDDVDVEVHGGLTFSDFCLPEETEATGICHVPEPGEEAHVYWLGFDCHHYLDIAPYDLHSAELLALLSEETQHATTYKTLAYVQEQCKQLAAQLSARAKGEK